MNPTYGKIGDHAETLRVTYDPLQISYKALVEAFFSFHDPFERPYSQQYRSVAFYQKEEEHQLLEFILEHHKTQHQHFPPLLQTELQLFTSFTSAEDRHQKYVLQKHPEFVSFLIEKHGDFNAFVDSTAAAKIGAYLTGLGDWTTFERDLPDMELSPELELKLKRLFSRYVLR